MAEQRVSELYAAIDITVTWLDPRARDGERRHGPQSDYDVMLLDDAMTERLRAPADVLGFAPDTPDQRGRLAYVFSDRVRRSADDNASGLAVVIAHELAHLLLPYGSHAAEGLMRPAWTAKAFRNTSPEALGFTSLESGELRRRAEPRRTHPPGEGPSVLSR